MKHEDHRTHRRRSNRKPDRATCDGTRLQGCDRQLAWAGIVIDTNNYYPQRDGHIQELDNESTTTSELLQAHLPTSKVVKAFNHIYAAQLTTDGKRTGTNNRRALAIAGDDPAAKATVTELLDQFGFDTVDAGPLKEGWRIQRDTPGYGPRRTAEELRKDLAAARRYADQ